MPAYTAVYTYSAGRKAMILMFKKVFCAVLVVCALMLVSVSAYAAVSTFTVDSVTFGSAATPLSDTPEAAPTITRSDLVTVKVSTPTAGAEVLMISVDSSIDLANASDSDIVAFDQVTADSTGKAELSFRARLTAGAGTYALYIKSTDATNPTIKYFKLDAAATTFLSGDVDESGEVNSTDSVYVLRHSLGLSLPASVVIEAGDVDGSGEVNSTDSVYILRHSLGLSVPDSVTVGQQVSQ